MSLIDAISEFEQLRVTRPSLMYRAGRTHALDGAAVAEIDNGQLQFHRSPHVVRQLAPGNGYGKTTTAAIEVDWWGHGDHPWPHDLPVGRPRHMVWICQKYAQWEQMRLKIEPWWPAAVVESWVGQPKARYAWPDGSLLFIITAETDWATVQGIEPDLVMVDEECPARLWREMLKRRRGDTRTRFCVTATATQGLSWMYHDLYLPWRRFHEAAGITDERDMMHRQLHRFAGGELAHVPGIWCWPQGGHFDNPTATNETWAFYLATTQGHPAERHVRLFGGFRDFAAQPVFEPSQLERMRSMLRDGVSGAVTGV